MPEYTNDPVVSKSTNGAVSVRGMSNGTALWGMSLEEVGVVGVGRHHGVYGETRASGAGAAGVTGQGVEAGHGVMGITGAHSRAGVFGVHDSMEGPGVYGRGKPAGMFEGDVKITGDLMIEDANLIALLDASNQRIAALEEKVASLRGQLESTIEMLRHHLQERTLTH
ncbi:hypothetical protein [Streptomyces bobili]